VAWLAWPDSGPDPRAREYRDSSACLLTGSAGVNDPAAAPVWTGMQAASLRTRGKVQYLEVDGPQTAAQAQTYLGTLLTSRCDVILAAGTAPVAAVAEIASRHPGVRFVIVGAGVEAGNVSVVDETDAAGISRTVEALVADVLAAAADD
jgi:DNA-binding LacI/PurR family transcriptional regulator